MESTTFITMTLFYVILGFAVVYILVIAPSKRREEEQESYYDKLSKRDIVRLSGGIFGRVVDKLENGLLKVEVSNNHSIVVDSKTIVPMEDSELEKIKSDVASHFSAAKSDKSNNKPSKNNKKKGK